MRRPEGKSSRLGDAHWSNRHADFTFCITAVRHEEARSSSPTPSQRQAQILQTQFSPQELAFQESLIQEREAEIREIETGIHELHEIFRDLGTLVQEQGGMLGECSASANRKILML